MENNSLLHPDIQSNIENVDGTDIHYLSAGSGETIILIHGWPTSSFLWRNIIPELTKNNHVIAIDLPGFGKSSKNLQDSYSFNYYEKVIDNFLTQLNIEKVHLVVHDLGGPLGLMWAVKQPEKVQSLVLLNTLVYPEFSWAVKLFMLASFFPGVKNYLTSEKGIVAAIRFGVFDKTKLNRDILTNYHQPFQTKEDRKVLLKTIQRLSPKGFKTIAEKLPSFEIPVRIIYGENDKILPDVANTMKRVKSDLPQAELFYLPNCGHFLQEDEPEKVRELLVDFYNAQ